MVVPTLQAPVMLLCCFLFTSDQIANMNPKTSCADITCLYFLVRYLEVSNHVWVEERVSLKRILNMNVCFMPVTRIPTDVQSTTFGSGNVLPAKRIFRGNITTCAFSRIFSMYLSTTDKKKKEY